MGDKWLNQAVRGRNRSSTPKHLSKQPRRSFPRDSGPTWDHHTQERRRLVRPPWRPAAMEGAYDDDDEEVDDSSEEEEDEEDEGCWAHCCGECVRWQRVCAALLAFTIITALLYSLFSAAEILPSSLSFAMSAPEQRPSSLPIISAEPSAPDSLALGTMFPTLAANAAQAQQVQAQPQQEQPQQPQLQQAQPQQAQVQQALEAAQKMFPALTPNTAQLQQLQPHLLHQQLQQQLLQQRQQQEQLQRLQEQQQQLLQHFQQQVLRPAHARSAEAQAQQSAQPVAVGENPAAGVITVERPVIGVPAVGQGEVPTTAVVDSQLPQQPPQAETEIQAQAGVAAAVSAQHPAQQSAQPPPRAEIVSLLDTRAARTSARLGGHALGGCGKTFPLSAEGAPGGGQHRKVKLDDCNPAPAAAAASASPSDSAVSAAQVAPSDAPVDVAFDDSADVTVPLGEGDPGQQQEEEGGATQAAPEEEQQQMQPQQQPQEEQQQQQEMQVQLENAQPLPAATVPAAATARVANAGALGLTNSAATAAAAASTTPHSPQSPLASSATPSLSSVSSASAATAGAAAAAVTTPAQRPLQQRFQTRQQPDPSQSIGADPGGAAVAAQPGAGSAAVSAAVDAVGSAASGVSWPAEAPRTFRGSPTHTLPQQQQQPQQQQPMQQQPEQQQQPQQQQQQQQQLLPQVPPVTSEPEPLPLPPQQPQQQPQQPPQQERARAGRGEEGDSMMATAFRACIDHTRVQRMAEHSGWPYLLVKGAHVGYTRQQEALLRALWVARATGSVLVLPAFFKSFDTHPSQETSIVQFFNTQYLITHMYCSSEVWAVQSLPASVQEELPAGASARNVDAILAAPASKALSIPREIVAGSADMNNPALLRWLETVRQETTKGKVRLLVYDTDLPLPFSSPDQQRFKKNGLAALRASADVSAIITQLLHRLRKAFQDHIGGDLSQFQFAALHVGEDYTAGAAADGGLGDGGGGGLAGAAGGKNGSSSEAGGDYSESRSGGVAAGSADGDSGGVLAAIREALLANVDPSQMLLYVTVGRSMEHKTVLQELHGAYHVVTKDTLIPNISRRFPSHEMQAAFEQGVAKEASIFLAPSTSAFSGFVFQSRCFTRPTLGQKPLRDTVFYDRSTSVAACHVRPTG